MFQSVFLSNRKVKDGVDICSKILGLKLISCLLNHKETNQMEQIHWASSALVNLLVAAAFRTITACYLSQESNFFLLLQMILKTEGSWSLKCFFNLQPWYVEGFRDSNRLSFHVWSNL